MLRALCLKLTVCDSFLNPLPANCSFQIHIHTTETSSIEIHKETEVSKLVITGEWILCSKHNTNVFKTLSKKMTFYRIKCLENI